MSKEDKALELAERTFRRQSSVLQKAWREQWEGAAKADRIDKARRAA